ncbi:DUF2512 family protein [Clostridium cylindrosporum]|uniref:DUF2512 family protein n=1 Tax=Clostridium cylindrosporum DSM 605 TaxID=1121307 RepID=A0A0J8DCA9_CLOCY|nr:DUF2512 family protein [Clostridium cylindrosporum]KMT21939.1 hypothetical protein CLCY_3c02100 [Clostridium cylindrosporum DSM 605]
MSRTSTALLIKFLLTLAAAWIAFSLFGATGAFTFVLVVGVVGTIINYLLGDLLILRNLGNIVGCICDGIISILTAYAIAVIYGIRFPATAYILFGVIIAVGEYFFHAYLAKNEDFSPKYESDVLENQKPNFNMEAGEDLGADDNIIVRDLREHSSNSNNTNNVSCNKDTKNQRKKNK